MSSSATRMESFIDLFRNVEKNGSIISTLKFVKASGLLKKI